jgi:hypothetical protein
MSATDDINEGGRTSSSNNGVDDINSSPAVRITLQVDNTSALPLFLQGRVRYLCEKRKIKGKKEGQTSIYNCCSLLLFCFPCVQK